MFKLSDASVLDLMTMLEYWRVNNQKELLSQVISRNVGQMETESRTDSGCVIFS